jgi:beta-N-acetylhexosaminidase
LKSPADAALLAGITAEILRILGFNMNFAPVVDVTTGDRAGFSNGLVTRAYGHTKEEVLEFSRAYLEKLQGAGCAGCLKHFPGLGASQVDSHEELPVVNVAEEEFFETDLFPYREFFKSGEIMAVMVAHAAYPRLDLQERDQNGKLLPSSLSFNLITKLLRGRLGFGGLVLTDDLEMGAIVKNYGIGEACKLAIGAGHDQLLICNDPGAVREGFDALLGAVRTGEIEESSIDNSLQRIARVKNLIKPPLPFDEDRLNELSKKISDLKDKLN